MSVKNKTIKRIIDHIVYTVSDLEKATNELEEKMGVRAIFGGYHSTQGTKNALINLDNKCYLELLAADDKNQTVKPPRWMGVDLHTKDQVTRIAIKSNDLGEDSSALKKFNNSMGEITRGSRNTATGSCLQWQLIMPLSRPEVELTPFMIDWSFSDIHPNEFLPDMGCKLIKVYGTHPQPKKFEKLFNAINYDFKIEEASIITLKAILQTPNGIIIL